MRAYSMDLRERVLCTRATPGMQAADGARANTASVGPGSGGSQHRRRETRRSRPARQQRARAASGCSRPQLHTLAALDRASNRIAP